MAVIAVNKVYCPICNNEANKFFYKGNTEYAQCSSCKTVWCGCLDQENKIGGKFEIERNANENHLRISRINEMWAGGKKEECNILDFGCGNFYLGRDLIKEGYNVDGYDAYNEKYSRLPERNKYDIVVMVECIEHLCYNYVELDVIHRSLKPNGAVMIETNFTDVAKEDGIEIEDFFYVTAADGHSTIFSHHGLDLLMSFKGFCPTQHWNRNVRCYIKK